MATKLPLVDLPRTLNEAGYTAPKYRACYNAAIDARIPVAKTETGRWTFRMEDLPAIASAMNLSQAQAA